jgi:hypothetical protein
MMQVQFQTPLVVLPLMRGGGGSDMGSFPMQAPTNVASSQEVSPPPQTSYRLPPPVYRLHLLLTCVFHPASLLPPVTSPTPVPPLTPSHLFSTQRHPGPPHTLFPSPVPTPVPPLLRATSTCVVSPLTDPSHYSLLVTSS